VEIGDQIYSFLVDGPSPTPIINPLLFILTPQNLGPLPIRFNPLWLDPPLISTLVHQAWGTSFNGSPNFVWESKLKFVNQVLKDWAKSTYIPPTQERQTRLNESANIQQK